MKFPIEFSFKLPDDRFKTIFFATKHDHQNQYAVAWKSTVFDDKIDITFYSASDVEELVNAQKWIVKEVFK